MSTYNENQTNSKGNRHFCLGIRFSVSMWCGVYPYTKQYLRKFVF